jgi:hypothetical protein
VRCRWRACSTGIAASALQLRAGLRCADWLVAAIAASDGRCLVIRALGVVQQLHVNLAAAAAAVLGCRRWLGGPYVCSCCAASGVAVAAV